MEEDNASKAPGDGQETARDPDAMPPAPGAPAASRPPAQAAEPMMGFPAGIERVLTLAALDDDFRAALRQERMAAVRSRGIELTPTEAQLLSAIPAPVLEHATDQILVPTSSRRAFIKAASDAALAILAGTFPLVLTGCPRRPARTLGIRPDEVFSPASAEPGRTRETRPDLPPQARPPGDFWIRAAGHTALLCVPAALGSGGRPIVLVFHDNGKTVLDAVRLWRGCASEKRHLIVGVKWSARPADIGSAAAAAGRMLDDLTADYDVSLAAPIVAAGAGLGAAVALEAALFADKRFSGAVAVHGALPDGWESRKLIDPRGSAVWLVAEQGNPTAKRLDRQIAALGQRGVTTQLVEASRPAASAADAARPAWDWLESLAL